MRKFTIFFIISTLILFITFEIYRRSEKIVLKVINPNVVQIDLNNNKIADDNEAICVANLETFTSNLLISQETLAKQYNISIKDAISLGFLTDNYAETLLSDKKIRLKYTGKITPECHYADIYINNENYAEKMYSYGFGIYNGKTTNAFKKNLERARKLKLAILNHRSNKYHELDCKYGLIAHDTVVVYVNELPKNALPCKFCHIKPAKEKHLRNSTTIKNIPPAPAQISNGSIKFLLTDFTTKLKPDRNCTSDVCRTILQEINKAAASIDIAIYGWEKVPALEQAFKNAAARGVNIRIVYDETTKGNSYYPDTSNLLALSKVHNSDKSSAASEINYIMHNKFLIIDNQTVITGSMNYSPTGLSGFNANNLILINSKDIAKLYEEEFSQMLEGKFHTAKIPSGNPRTFLIGNSKVSVYFSPQDKVITNNIILIVNNAKNYIYIPAFLITHEGLTTALIKAKARGVDVKIILDATNVSSYRSASKNLRAANIPLKVENYAGKLHSKSMIIDDKFIITGSMNFSNSGEKRNDENILVIEDTRLAIFYRNFFNYLWKKIPDKYLKQNVRAESWNSIGSCTDGIDNNFDGKIDSEDAGCFPVKQ